MAEVEAVAGSMAAVRAVGSIAGSALHFMAQEPDAPLAFLTAAEEEGHRDASSVVIVRTREDFVRWLRDPARDVDWLQVEGLLGDQEVWAMAAQGMSTIPLDVILTNPAGEFSSLYRLVDVRIVRGVRVTISA